MSRYQHLHPSQPPPLLIGHQPAGEPQLFLIHESFLKPIFQTHGFEFQGWPLFALSRSQA